MNALQKIIIYIKMSARAILDKPSLQTLTGVIKFFPAWFEHLASARNSISDKMPWLSFGAIEYLKKIIEPDMQVFEYGSGGSTLFWASRVKQVVSIEHDKAWFDKLQDYFIRNKIKNVKYELVAPEVDHRNVPAHFNNPNDYVSADENFAGKSFELYAKKIDEYPDEYFDIIIVDGRARPSCILHAIKKVKQGGHLIVDNSERNYYFSSFSFNKRDWKKLEFLGPVPYILHFSKTTIIKKLNAIETS
jgi:hypothetical protein